MAVSDEIRKGRQLAVKVIIMFFESLQNDDYVANNVEVEGLDELVDVLINTYHCNGRIELRVDDLDVIPSLDELKEDLKATLKRIEDEIFNAFEEPYSADDMIRSITNIQFNDIYWNCKKELIMTFDVKEDEEVAD
jgi:hypothetical protein